MPVSEETVRKIHDTPSLLKFLRDELRWPLPDTVSVEDVTFEWSPDELKLHEKTQSRLKDGIVRQLQPMVTGQPWGIFIVEFNDVNVYKTKLREILRGLVPRRKRDSKLPSWKHEDILFICTTTDRHFTLAHFRGEKPERAKLVRFSWAPDEPMRTVCEYNLPALNMPESVSEWTRRWEEAFDVQKVTDAFFEDYTTVFADLQNLLGKQTKDAAWAHDFSLQFLNRIMFIYFIQKKEWIGNDKRFVKKLWDEYKNRVGTKDTFYEEWLSILFFEAFNNKYQNRAEYLKRFPESIHKAFASAPYLNGGLFYQNDLDDKHSFHIPDNVFVTLFDNFSGTAPGFLERYNFTISEDTPLDQEVAVDPEMIGKVYESLVNISSEGVTGEDLRGKAGIFYTPRIEIDLMCRLSLTDWLTNQLGQENKGLIREAVFAYSTEEKREVDARLTEKNLWGKIDGAIRLITVLDIACGSGSFLVGMLLVLDDLQARANKILGNQETAYQRRKRIIGQSLYGVDVMDWAVHVAELRLWLQLMVETELHPAELKLTPLLPNLSFKVRCGDSLVQEVGGINMGLHTTHSELSPASKGKLTALKGEKLNYYQGQYKDSMAERKKLERDEFNIFRGILLEKQHSLMDEIVRLKRKIENPEPEQIELLSAPKQRAHQLDIRAQNWSKEKEAKESELARIKAAVAEMKSEKDVPFVWDIAFVEVFEGDRKGFDIVIGNPPYVRQEEIADPRLDASDSGGEKSDKWKASKTEYKAKLQRSAYEAYPQYFGYDRVKNKAAKKLNGKSDLYLYFYFHGLRLLNEKGSFCFITSNSWLDVGYGADLQEFLLKRCEVKLVIDNEVKRSFAQADVNTVICLFSAPGLHTYSDKARENTARFVMFKVPFEEALSPVLFDEIDQVSERLRRPEFRVVAKRQSELLEEGTEIPDDEEAETAMSKASEFSGDKWGGKYLRAPEIYFTILEKAKDKLVRLGDIAEVRFGIKTGANEFFYLDEEKIAEWKIEKEFLKPVIFSLKELKSISGRAFTPKWRMLYCHDSIAKLKGSNVLKYIRWGESKKFNSRPSTKGRRPWYSIGEDWVPAPLIFPAKVGERYLVLSNGKAIFEDKKLYGITPRGKSLKPSILGALLNSTLTRFFVDITCRQLTGA